MDRIRIVGGRPLAGSIPISGAKNATLPLMIASLLTDEVLVLENVPRLADVALLQRILGNHGVDVMVGGKRPGDTEYEGQTLHISAKRIVDTTAPYELVAKMRASFWVIAPLIARMGEARVSLPGGCAIGARPIDMHLRALEQMGAKVELREGYVEVFARHLRGADITFNKVTVTGTENIMMAAVLADGTTALHNAAREPEVVALAEHLIAMGADIEGAGTDRIVVHGVDGLSPASHSIIPDRIEAGTLLMAAGITGGELTIENFPAGMLETLSARLQESGISIEAAGDAVRVRANGRPKSVDVTTAPHPGFATDLQAQFMALMALSRGTSIITETIFENRFMHVSELCRMGAEIAVEGGTAVVKGVEGLKGAPVMATDLRASASLVLAGLAAEGTTEVRRIYHLDRGYERIEEKLARLGARIERQPDVED
jgi:UDP-N-acetylglucosamine 1-carboxyvinyltransferase